VWELGLALATGAAVGLMFIGIEDQRSAQAEALEDARFVREHVRELSLTDQCRLPLRRLNLADMSLAGLDLTGADLANSDLSGADLTLAILRGANLEGANLSGARLVEADLSSSNLSRADLSGADATGADLSDVRITDTKLLVTNVISEKQREQLEGAAWNPDLPPTWPQRFIPPENTWTNDPWSFVCQ